jgi:hypothetical protein
MEEDHANMLWNILNKAVKDTISYDQGTKDSLTLTIKDFPLHYLESNRQYLYFFSRGGEGYQNFKKMGFTFTRDKRWPHIDINFPCSRTGVDHHLLGIIPVASPQAFGSIIPSGVVSSNTTNFPTFANNNNAESYTTNNNNNINSSNNNISNSIFSNNSSAIITTNTINSDNNFTGKIICCGTYMYLRNQ